MTLCDPIAGSPPGSPVPGILQARILEWVAISFSNAWKWKVKVKSLNRVRLLATPWSVAYQAPPSMRFSRQEYWSGLPLPSPQHADDTTLMAESEEKLKSLLMKVKEEGEKVGLKLNIQKAKIMASSPITSWEIDGETVETVSDFILWGLQNHCRWWLQPWNKKTLTLWQKSYDQPRHIKKQRHCLANKGQSSQGYGFFSSHVWMWVGL